MLPVCHHVLVAACVKTVTQNTSQQVLTSTTSVKTILQSPSQQVSVSKIYGGSQAPLSNSDEEESDEVEECDFESRGMLFRERAQDLEKKMDRAVKEQEEDSSEDADTSDCDSDEGWGDWVDEEEEPGEELAKKKCTSRAVQLFLHSKHFCHCMALR